MANTKRNDTHAADEQTFTYDIAVLHEIARQVNRDAIHGPQWMKAGRFRPGPGLGDLKRERQEAAAADVVRKTSG